MDNPKPDPDINVKVKENQIADLISPIPKISSIDVKEIQVEDTVLKTTRQLPLTDRGLLIR